MSEGPDVPILIYLDAYLLAHGWMIREPRSPYEDANFGNSVYEHPEHKTYNGHGRPCGWVDAICKQADMEAETAMMEKASEEGD